MTPLAAQNNTVAIVISLQAAKLEKLLAAPPEGASDADKAVTVELLGLLNPIVAKFPPVTQQAVQTTADSGV